MEKMLVGCFLLLFGPTLLLLPAEARERRPPPRSISRGRQARTHPQTALLDRWHPQRIRVCDLKEHFVTTEQSDKPDGLGSQHLRAADGKPVPSGQDVKPGPKSTCENKRADVVFIIDSSRSVNTHDYAKVKEFIVDILQFLDIGPDVTRVGLLQYGSTVKNEFSLKTFKRKSEVERAVKRMRHLSTGTMTGLAIQYALNIAFSEAEGARPLRENVPRVIMIVTDGRPQDSVAEVAAKARDTGILIFAIGVGQVDFNTLKAIGSEPHEDHVFLVANFSQIETLTSVFQKKLCTVHMCSILEHNCAHFCINTPGSYVCRCKQGYILNSDEKTCRIQDLCAADDHGCEQLCVNLLGSFVCQCYSGYALAVDGKRCEPVDYCASENHGCEHECVNADGSYLCRCPKGFALNPDKKTCAKIDYCASPNHGCQHECVNTDDSYACRCLKGFTLNPDQKTCRRINYCALNKPGCEHECINTEEGYYCRCRRGYTLDPNGKTCSRVFPVWSPAGVDHCAEQDHGCEQLCLNTEDSFVCQCSEGFLINDDLKTCSRVDYCLLSHHGCEYSCVNTDRSFVCECPEGHMLRSDGKTCAKLDACALGKHGCEHSCVSSGDSFVCRCFEGYILREDGKTCRRKDVCQAVDHGCEHACVSTGESYVCKCMEGFRLAEDGKRCRRNGCFSEVTPGPSVFGEELREQVGEWLSFSETGEIPQKNLDVVEETVVQAEEAADEIPRKLEKQEKKRLKKEKTGCHCPGIARKKQCEETSERPKENRKPQKAPQEDGMEDPSVSFCKPKKKKPFSKKELVSSDLEETASSGSLSKRKKSFPKEEPVGDLKESGNKRVPEKKEEKFFSKGKPLCSGPEDAATSKSSGSKRKKTL
ncbi:hypothetical protein MJG53_009626 [Ovis ammon polii x Ovis aries]|uniref:Uncharacterized protein n=1 Tax=Ovis ammon polii x Ovis aries TaxID=2918886 RepID=A0ACB9UX81_9CETA|nr:hypothetical protein MJG53_009626 [Ovis ammon polii x Ovis aries]